MKCTDQELDICAIRDLISDAEVSEECVANNGPFTGMTREQHITYAAKCRAQVEQYRNGGAHKTVLAN